MSSSSGNKVRSWLLAPPNSQAHNVTLFASSLSICMIHTVDLADVLMSNFDALLPRVVPYPLHNVTYYCSATSGICTITRPVLRSTYSTLSEEYWTSYLKMCFCLDRNLEFWSHNFKWSKRSVICPSTDHIYVLLHKTRRHTLLNVLDSKSW
jgi:hypothetical protein